MKLRRNQKIILSRVEDNFYKITNTFDKLLVDPNEDYFIYMKNVNFKEGIIEGRFLGETDGSIVDKYCKEVYYDDELKKWKLEDGKIIKSARMVAVNNKTLTVVIIQ